LQLVCCVAIAKADVEKPGAALQDEGTSATVLAEDLPIAQQAEDALECIHDGKENHRIQQEVSNMCVCVMRNRMMVILY